MCFLGGKNMASSNIHLDLSIFKYIRLNKIGIILVASAWEWSG